MKKKLDDIGVWSEAKLNIIEEYAKPYMDIIRKRNFKAHYIDGFSGAGIHIQKDSGDLVPGSPMRVLALPKPFDTYHFTDIDGDKVGHLKQLCANKFPNVKVDIRKGDCNELLMKLLPTFSWKNYDRLFCLLDPYALNLQWKVIQEIGDMGIVDLILNFPIMDINRNVILKNQDNIPAEEIKRMNAFWGDETWRDVAYKESSQLEIFSDPSQEKQNNEVISNAFKDRLIEHGKFKYVPKPIPLKNSKNATIYYLFFASQNKTADKIATDLFKKYGG